MWASAFLLIFLCQIQSGWFCPCNGVVIPGTDQDHCWEVVTGGTDGGWVAGDVACQSVGGHLGHLNTNLTALLPYIQKFLSAEGGGNNEKIELAQVYTRPILTGIIAANAETQRYSLICPNNAYYGLLNSTMEAALLAQNATNSSTCAFVTNADYKIHFAPCSTASDALCDRPVNKLDYCNIQMNCTTTTTATTSTSSYYSSSSSLLYPTSSSSTPTTSTTTTTKSASTTATTSTPSTTSNVSSSITPTSYSSTNSSVSSTASPTTSTSTAKASTASTESTTNATVSVASTPTTSNAVTVVPTIPPSATTCPTVNDCDWKIFGTCAPWFLWVALALLILGILGWLCTCCGRREKNQVIQSEQHLEHTLPPTVGRSAVSYSPEPMLHNPPIVVESAPIVMVPFKMSPGPVRKETVEKFTKEIHVVEKEKIILKDIGVNTDLWTPTLAVTPKPAPVPIEIHDDPADDVSLDMTPTPGLDDHDDNFTFSRNPKPDAFGDMPIGDAPPAKKVPRDPATVINLTADPRNIRSPPSKERNVHLPTDDVKSFSPISDVSETEDANPKKMEPRFASLPKRRPKIPEPMPTKPATPNNENSRPKGADSGINTDAPPPGHNNRGSAPEKSNSRNNKSNDDQGQPPAGRPPRSPYGGGSGSSGNPVGPSPAPAPLMKPADVSIRAAYGKLGGVVRAGGGPEDQAPQGWKPWSKSS